jgi:hypothetical protein
VSLQWNDNISVSDQGSRDDVILRPSSQFDGSYPLTAWNQFRVKVGVGYEKYFKHDEYSRLYLESGSELSFDAYVKDWWINVHDRFQYTHDPGKNPGVAGVSRYGGLDNKAGLTGTWDLQDVVATFGYDHQNYFSSSSSYKYMDRASELLSARGGFKLRPRLTAGLEGTGSFTAYDEPVLNDSQGYSAGGYLEWQPGEVLRAELHAGYAAYYFDQTSRVVKATDQDSWYVGLSISHAVTDWMTYSLGAGHELRLGVQADTIEASNARLNFQWQLVKDLSLNTAFSYEHGQQGQGQAALVDETYDHFGASLGVSRNLTRRLSLAFSYRFTLRASGAASREYAQNLLELQATYQFK